MQDRPVLLVSDRPDRAGRLARGIALLMPCRVVASGAALPAMPPLAWVIDLDLYPVVGTVWFEDLRGRIRPETPCLYVSRGVGSRDSAAIGLLGTPIIVPAIFNLVDDLSRLFARFVGNKDEPEDEFGYPRPPNAANEPRRPYGPSVAAE